MVFEVRQIGRHSRQFHGVVTHFDSVAVATSNICAQLSEQSGLPILLLLFGTLASSAAGQVFYQTALTATQNDNGYVTMFFLLTPALTPLISLPLSRWIPDLQFVAGPLFFIGVALVTVPLFFFSLSTWPGAQARRNSSDINAEAAPNDGDGDRSTLSSSCDSDGARSTLARPFFTDQNLILRPAVGLIVWLTW